MDKQWNKKAWNQNFLAAGFLCLAFSIFFLPISTSFIAIFSLTGLGFVLLSQNFMDTFKWIKNPLTLSFWFLLALFLFGCLYGKGNLHSQAHEIKKYSWLFYIPLFLTLNLTLKQRNIIIKSYLASCALVLFLSYLKWVKLQFYSDNSLDTSVFTNHILESLYLALALGLCLYYFLNQRRYQWLYLGFAVLIVIYLLCFNNGRTGYLLTLAVLMYFFTIKFKAKGLLLGALVGILLLLAAFFLSDTIHQTIITTWQHIQGFHQGETHTSVGFRLGMYQNSLVLFKQNPWIGFGTGSIKAAYATLPHAMESETGLAYQIESLYFNFLLHFGLVGLLSLAGVFIWQWVAAGYCALDDKLLIRLTLFIIAVEGLVNPAFNTFHSARLYGLMLVVGFSSFQKFRKYKCRLG